MKINKNQAMENKKEAAMDVVKRMTDTLMTFYEEHQDDDLVNEDFMAILSNVVIASVCILIDDYDKRKWIASCINEVVQVGLDAVEDRGQ